MQASSMHPDVRPRDMHRMQSFGKEGISVSDPMLPGQAIKFSYPFEGLLLSHGAYKPFGMRVIKIRRDILRGGQLQKRIRYCFNLEILRDRHLVSVAG